MDNNKKGHRFDDAMRRVAHRLTQQVATDKMAVTCFGFYQPRRPERIAPDTAVDQQDPEEKA